MQFFIQFSCLHFFFLNSCLHFCHHILIFQSQETHPHAMQLKKRRLILRTSETSQKFLRVGEVKNTRPYRVRSYSEDLHFRPLYGLQKDFIFIFNFISHVYFFFFFFTVMLLTFSSSFMDFTLLKICITCLCIIKGFPYDYILFPYCFNSLKWKENPFFVKKQHLSQSNKEYLISLQHLSEPTSCNPFSESFFNADSSLPIRSYSSSFR